MLTTKKVIKNGESSMDKGCILKHFLTLKREVIKKIIHISFEIRRPSTQTEIIDERETDYLP